MYFENIFEWFNIFFFFCRNSRSLLVSYSRDCRILVWDLTLWEKVENELVSSFTLCFHRNIKISRKIKSRRDRGIFRRQLLYAKLSWLDMSSNTYFHSCCKFVEGGFEVLIRLKMRKVSAGSYLIVTIAQCGWKNFEIWFHGLSRFGLWML